MKRAILAGSVLVLATVGAWAQSAPAPAFDVASIKPSDPAARGGALLIRPGGRFTTNNIPLRMLITFAYDVRQFQLSGGPSWLDTDRYDIVATSEAAPDEDVAKMTDEQRQSFQKQLRLKVQALLADRFQLKIHRDTKELPVYALLVSKNGPKMQQDSDKPGPMIRGGGRGQVTGQSVPTMLLAQFLSEQVGRTVLDKTGLTGKYDFSLQWTPDESLQQRGPGDGPERDLLPPVDQNGPSIFTALQDQLGLRLESQKAPVEVIVIDSVQKASEN